MINKQKILSIQSKINIDSILLIRFSLQNYLPNSWKQKSKNKG